MSENLVRAERTAIDARTLYDEFRARWGATVESEPTRSRVLVLVAHVWHETAGGMASYGWNLAGIKYSPRCGHDYYQVQTSEVISGKPCTVIAAFRSYPDLAASVADYMALLRGRYGVAWASVENGDPAGFAHALRSGGYYTAPEGLYTAALVRRYGQVGALISEDTEPSTPISIARAQPTPGTDDDDQPTPPGDLPPTDGSA